MSSNRFNKKYTSKRSQQKSKEYHPKDDASSSNVILLHEVRNTLENKSFHGLNYDLMQDLFKGSDTLEVARILRSDSPPSQSEFDLKENDNGASSSNDTHCLSDNFIITSNTPTMTPNLQLNLQESDNEASTSKDTQYKNLICSSDTITANLEFNLQGNDNGAFSSKNTHRLPDSFIITYNTPTLTSDLEFNFPENDNGASTSKDTHSLPDNFIVISNMPTVTADFELDVQENGNKMSTSEPTNCLPDNSIVTSNIPTKTDDLEFDVQGNNNKPSTTNDRNYLPDDCIITCYTPNMTADLELNVQENGDGTSTSKDTHYLPDNLNMTVDELPESPSILPDNDLTDCESLVSNNDQTDSPIDDSDADPNYQQEFQDNPINESLSNDSLSSLSETENVPHTRKRKANPVKWKKNRAKTLRNSGQQYRALKKGNLVAPRVMGPPCSQICRLKCSEKLNEEIRQIFFQRFWALQDLHKQRNFIHKSMQTIQPKYRYPGNGRARSLNSAFYFYVDDTKIRVCKNFFISTLGITNRCIRTVVEKTKDGFLSDDQRGKHENHFRTSEDAKNGARNHIASIPTVESHYTRADSQKNYIEGGRTLTDLYNDYKLKCHQENCEFVSLCIYRQIFNYEFNLEFFKPKKDLCQFCESYKNMTTEERLSKELEYMKHHEEKLLSRTEKEEDKKKISNNYRVACFDLQAALPTPKGEVSTFYYKSKLSTYNFTVCDLNKKGLGSVNCYLWHEGEGHKGSNEIGSSLLHYLQQCCLANCDQDDDNLEITFYSDNCGGQGKNKFIIAAYLYAVSNLKIKSITHQFLVVGHTQNEGDVSHSLIEKNIKKALKSGHIYLPSQYASLISTARKSGPPFQVHELDHEFFYDLKDLVEATCTNFNVNTDGEKFNFNDICTLKVEKDNPGKYFYKVSYKEEYKAVDVGCSRTRKKLKSFEGISLKKAYSDKIAISNRKYNDLMSLVNSNTIPRCHSAFFENLKHD